MVGTVCFCLLVFVCLASCSLTPARSDVWTNLQAHISDIYDRNEGKKSPKNINLIAAKLRDRIDEAIENISEGKLKLKEIGRVWGKDFQDIEDTYDLTEFFDKVGRALEFKSEFKNTRNNGLIYYF